MELKDYGCPFSLFAYLQINWHGKSKVVKLLLISGEPVSISTNGPKF
jgi:hypothetical protein